MMNGNDDRACEIVGLCSLQCGRQKVHLPVIKHAVGAILAGDDARILKNIAVETEDSHEWRLQREVHAGLNHGGAQEAS